jgi:hypothetical protein
MAVAAPMLVAMPLSHLLPSLQGLQGVQQQRQTVDWPIHRLEQNVRGNHPAAVCHLFVMH